MEVKAQVAMEVKLLTERKGKVVFHIVKDPTNEVQNEIILGTNAFATLGIKVIFEPKEEKRTPAFPSRITWKHQSGSPSKKEK